MKNNHALNAFKSLLQSYGCLSNGQLRYNLTPFLSKAILVGFTIAASSFAWALPANVNVLKRVDNCYLVKTESGREAVYVKSKGQDVLIGYVGKIRKGMPLYHWGNATPEQAAKWNAAGSISPGLLSYLISTNEGAYGGGFYASTDRTDSMHYGNTQITIIIPQDIKIVDKAVNADQILNEPGVNEHIAKLGISAFRNSNMPTWHNFIDANSLTKEHVTTLIEWKDSWKKAQFKTALLKKFPELLQFRQVQTENKRYLNYLNLIRSPDVTVQLSALEYFYSIKDTDGLFLVLKSVSQKIPENAQFVKVVKEFMRINNEDSRTKVVEFFSKWDSPEALKCILDYYREFPKERGYVYALLGVRKEVEAVEALKSMARDVTGFAENYMLADSLKGRSDTLSLEMIKQMVNERPTVAFEALRGRQDSASLDYIESQMMEHPEESITALTGRKDDKSLQIIEKILKGSDSRRKNYALNALVGRDDPRVSKMLEPFFADLKAVPYYALRALRGRQDARSLAIIKRLLNAPEVDQNLVFDAFRDRTDAASVPILERIILGEDLRAKVKAVQLLVYRSDAKAIESVKKLISKKILTPNEIENILPAHLASAGSAPSQIEKSVNALQVSDLDKFELVRGMAVKSVDTYLNVPRCQNIFVK